MAPVPAAMTAIQPMVVNIGGLFAGRSDALGEQHQMVT
jgi:hypothetical protein